MRDKHLSTDNYTIIRREYLTSMVLPSLSAVQKEGQQISRDYVVAGKNIRLYFYNEALAEKLSLPFRHLPSVPQGEAIALTVHMWDSVNRDDMASPWDTAGHSEHTTSAEKEISDDFFGTYLGEQTLNLYDKGTRTAYFWTRDGSLLPDWITAAPLRTILNWFLTDQGIHLVHGGAVGVGGKVVLLSAPGGSGKSTTTLSCLLSGMDYLGDDYVGIETGEKHTVHCLFNSAKITPNTIPTFPEMKERIWNKGNVGGKLDGGKAVIFLQDLFPGQIPLKGELVAILIPVIKKETRLVPASKLQTMLALAPTTIFQLPLARADKMASFRRIIDSVPCYFLELGPDIRNTPEAIKEFLRNQGPVQ